MRVSCLDCARKHIAEAEVLMREALMGYPNHSWLAVGHLSQAESELLGEFPDMAHTIRAERINYIESLEYKIDEEILISSTPYEIDSINLIEKLTILSVEKPIE